MAFFRFMASGAGRALRIVVGLALSYIGFGIVHGVGGVVLGLVGLFPLGAGAFDVCLLAPLFHKPFRGSELRHASSST